jgi:hypothetical protein
MRVVWNNDLPPAVLVVTKNVRDSPVACAGSDGLEGLAMAGAKARLLFSRAVGTTKVAP